jgi:hypothetical protein
MHKVGDTHTDSNGVAWLVVWVARDGSGYELERVGR